MYHVTKILLSIFFVSITLSSISQHSSQASNWYFGWNSGITFNTTNGHPQPLYDGQIHQNEGCASISDSNGVATTANASATRGINAVDKALENGNPIEVGVDYKPKQVNNIPPNGDGMTDHFIVVSS